MVCLLLEDFSVFVLPELAADAVLPHDGWVVSPPDGRDAGNVASDMVVDESLDRKK